MSFVEKMKKNYESLWKMIIKPKRTKYSEYDLGPKLLEGEKGSMVRVDFSIGTPKKEKLPLSLFEFQPNSKSPIAHGTKKSLKPKPKPPVVIYCHTFEGNRIEGLFLVELCIENGFDLILFDFSGAGHGSGKYLTLGYNEKGEVGAVVNHAKKSLGYERVVLWGRSMGAASSILWGASHPKEISLMVLDSPFYKLESTIVRIAQKIIDLPSIMIRAAISILESTVQKKTGAVLSEIKPGYEIIRLKGLPIVLGIGLEDDIVLPKEIEKMSKILKKNHLLLKFPGAHSAERSHEMFYRPAFEFIKGRIEMAAMQKWAKGKGALNENGAKCLSLNMKTQFKPGVSHSLANLSFHRKSFRSDFQEAPGNDEIRTKLGTEEKAGNETKEMEKQSFMKPNGNIEKISQGAPLAQRDEPHFNSFRQVNQPHFPHPNHELKETNFRVGVPRELDEMARWDSKKTQKAFEDFQMKPSSRMMSRQPARRYENFSDDKENTSCALFLNKNPKAQDSPTKILKQKGTNRSKFQKTSALNLRKRNEIEEETTRNTKIPLILQNESSKANTESFEFNCFPQKQEATLHESCEAFSNCSWGARSEFSSILDSAEFSQVLKGLENDQAVRRSENDLKMSFTCLNSSTTSLSSASSFSISKRSFVENENPANTPTNSSTAYMPSFQNPKNEKLSHSSSFRNFTFTSSEAAYQEFLEF